MSDIALKDFIENQLKELELRLTERMNAAEKAVAKAEEQMNFRLQGMNE